MSSSSTKESVPQTVPETTNQSVTAPKKKIPHVVNNGGVAATVKLKNANGQVDYIHVMGRRHVRLPSGHTVDPNYLVLNPHVKVTDIEV